MCEDLDESIDDVVVASFGRRGAIKGLSAAVIALLTFPASVVRAKRVGLPMSKLKRLQDVGGSMMLKLKGKKLLLVRDTETSVRAFNPVCTHKKCNVKWKPDKGRLQCKCHKSAFKLDGTVLGGPAKRNLQVYPASLSAAADKVIVTLPD